MSVAIKPLHPRFAELELLPRRMSELAAGFDLRAALDTPIVLAPGERRAVPCGFAMALPAGIEAQVRPRSGLALKHGVTLLNSPGTIDADYRGEVAALLVNLGQAPFTITPGLRIAQVVFARHEAPELRLTAELDGTARGANGFGSTGA